MFSDDEVVDMYERAQALTPHAKHGRMQGGNAFVSAADYTRAIATRAVELIAARGGMLTADALLGPNLTDEVRRHIAVQGARIAVLENAQADLEGQVSNIHAATDCTADHREPRLMTRCALQSVETLRGEHSRITALEQHVSDLEKSLENVRQERDTEHDRLVDALSRERSEKADAAVWRKRLEAAAEALADVLPGDAGRLDLLSRIAALKAERNLAVQRAVGIMSGTLPEEFRARLSSALGALNEALQHEGVDDTTAPTANVGVNRPNHPGFPESSPAGQVAEDVVFLADQRAQLVAAKLMLTDAQREAVSRIRHHGELPPDIARLAAAAQERDAAIASRDEANERYATAAKAAEEALADNAALLAWVPHGMTCSIVSAGNPRCDCIRSSTHPGAALLEEHRKALETAWTEGTCAAGDKMRERFEQQERDHHKELARARNEGIEKVAKRIETLKPGPMITSAETLAKLVREMKEPENVMIPAAPRPALDIRSIIREVSHDIGEALSAYLRNPEPPAHHINTAVRAAERALHQHLPPLLERVKRLETDARKLSDGLRATRHAIGMGCASDALVPISILLQEHGH